MDKDKASEQQAVEATHQAPEQDDDGDEFYTGERRAQLVQDTIANAMRSRHPLDLHWSVAAPTAVRTPMRARRCR